MNPDARTPSLDLGVIGNSSAAALIDREASIVWMCVPRMDGDPVFCSLLGGGIDYGAESGRWSISLRNQVASEQQYLHNTAILETVLTDGHGNRLRIVAFAPRFKMSGRMFRPQGIVRLIDAGYLDRILVSHDVFLKMMLTHYGGNGYAFVPKHFLPRLKRHGVAETALARLMHDNPRSVFDASV